MSDYEGDDIQIEEMPQGCVISFYYTANYTGRWVSVTIGSNRDILALISSLTRLLQRNISEGIG